MPQVEQADTPLDVAAVLKTYDSQGIHRSAHPADESSAAWLLDAAKNAGAHATIEDRPFDRIDLGDCYVEIDGTRIPGIPAFDAPLTGPSGITGVLGAGIGLETLGPLSIYQPAYEPWRRSANHTALVAVTQGGRPGLALHNAEHFLHPYGLPMLQVASEHGPALAAAAANGARVRVVCDAQRASARLGNVVATIPGRDPAARPLVVMTPRSGWWTCASERGGGIVCWLAVLDAFCRDRPRAPVTMVATSGHELGHVGLDDFIARRTGLASGANWLHFGANLGARHLPPSAGLTLQSPQDDLRRLGVAALEAAGHPPPLLSPPGTVPNGESRDIHRAGGRYLTLVGGNSLFHLPQDRYPDAVDIPAIDRIARAAVRIARAMAGG